MLEDLGKMHNIWVAMSLNLGVPPHMVEDLVQEMYIRIHKYITDKQKIYYQDKGINRFYIWTVLRNMWKSVQTLKAKNPIVSFSEYYGELEIDDTRSEYMDSLEIQEKKAYNKLLNKINETVNEWDYWYDKKLFELYYNSDMSMRDISEKTKISLTSIFNSCKNYKSKILQEHFEDYLDYKNGDYDKL